MIVDETVSSTNVPGSAVKFDFDGSFVSVHAPLQYARGRLIVSYALDGGDPSTEVHFDGTQAVDHNVWTHTQLFNQTLSPGSHSLVVKLVEATEDQQLFLDYIAVRAILSTRLQPPKRLSVGAKEGITIGVLVGGALLAFVVWRMYVSRFFGRTSGPVESYPLGVARAAPNTDEALPPYAPGTLTSGPPPPPWSPHSTPEPPQSSSPFPPSPSPSHSAPSQTQTSDTESPIPHPPDPHLLRIIDLLRAPRLRF
ncbi:hypothetical protein M422DRAFT_51225 [Sphaerobolus stellatus SS14]|uniref:Uncharacterized protein n=1 Tax=Sphaerobolus stellatus (strain SS14) TaxID=990650 RepID=A0A0C9U017_SPHS4|nr:hypothetical protein M422DRAFT_51225 [Sphaerobolus stellatus SS14]